MAKIKLDLSAPPATFNHLLNIVLKNGDEAELNIEYIYRDGDAMAEYTESINNAMLKAQADAGKPELLNPDQPANPPKKVNLAKDRKARIAKDVAEVLNVAKGWDLADDFNAANLTKFENKYPGALLAILTGYFAASQELRIKN